MHSKLVSLKVRNLGCIGPEGLEIALDKIVCLVGRNNAGKSTVIRAYELAVGTKSFAAQDRCQWTPEGDYPEVELSVHIPDGTLNVDPKWKIDQSGLRIVRSRWQWREGLKKVRQTWDPEANDWDTEQKAGGADNVFNSRLPKPLRVDALQDALNEHDELLKLLIDPVSKDLRQLESETDSPLQSAIQQFVAEAMKPVEQYQEAINRIGTRVHEGFCGIFPELQIDIRVDMAKPTIDSSKLLLAGSSIRFKEGSADTNIRQQGNGSRRAIFWTLLQVRNGIVHERETESQKQDAEASRIRELDKQKKKLVDAKAAKKINESKITEITELIERLESNAEADDSEPAFPGYILLLDEPENCLHPMAVRAARSHLYALANDPNWQIMLSTHSPYFVDPLADHTTIVRLERKDRHTSPCTYRTNTAQFSEEERANLRALLQLDSAVAEMFFGSYPIIVEGDTELAAFIAAILEDQDPICLKTSLVAARGKALIAPLIKLMTHFAIPFGVLHDSDSPRRTDSGRNSAWIENSKIAQSIIDARQHGLTVIHRISIPDFERAIGMDEGGKDKPLNTYRTIREDDSIRAKVKTLFQNLVSSNQDHFIDTLASTATADDSNVELQRAVTSWAAEHASNDARFRFD